MYINRICLVCQALVWKTTDHIEFLLTKSSSPVETNLKNCRILDKKKGQECPVACSCVFKVIRTLMEALLVLTPTWTTSSAEPGCDVSSSVIRFRDNEQIFLNGILTYEI